VPVPLSAADYVELLPAVWRAVNAYGIKISHRTYDAEELNPIRQQKSGVAAQKGKWEVHHDPYDVSRVFVRGPDGWITCPWKYLEKVPAPSGNWPGTTSPASSPSMAGPPPASWSAPLPSMTCCAVPTTARPATPGRIPQALPARAGGPTGS